MAIDVTVGDSLRNAFGQALLDLADDNEFLVLDADLAGGCGLSDFREAYPDRLINVGIAEQA